ncbi:hypothetical protein RND81_04G041900 [Saponaria officinalis]|uniref:Uncharacterized protein n=1 Tax=Saponaria officinalis TaxID=3572 RepID=A0AAW1LHU2_SAPOF
MQHEIDHRRQCEQNAFGAGGSRVDPQLHRSGSVQETIARRDDTFEPTNTVKSRLRARVVDLEKDHLKQKQSKINTGWLKKAKKQLIKAWGNFMIDTNTPFRAVESPYPNPFMQTIREVGDGVRAPTTYDIAEIYLPETYNEMKEYIKTLAPI